MLSCLPAAQADIKLKTCGHMWRKSAFGFTQWADHALMKMSWVTEEDYLVLWSKWCSKLAMSWRLSLGVWIVTLYGEKGT